VDGPLVLACAQVAARSGIGLMLAGAGIAKLSRRETFRDAVAAYRLLPLPLVEPAALALPVAEIAIGLGLIAGVWMAGTAVAGAALLLVFAAAIAINLLRGRTDVDCGCDPTATPKPIAWNMVWRNLGLVALLLACLAPAPALSLDLSLAAAATGGLAFLLFFILSLLRSFAPQPARTSRARSGAR
jgi:hypothetical protein